MKKYGPAKASYAEICLNFQTLLSKSIIELDFSQIFMKQVVFSISPARLNESIDIYPIKVN